MGHISLKVHKNLNWSDAQRENAKKNKEWEERDGDDKSTIHWEWLQASSGKISSEFPVS